VIGRRQRQRGLRRLFRERVPYTLWQLYVRDLPLLAGLSVGERCRLRHLSGQFLREKQFRAVHGLHIDDRMRLTIAAVACLPILELGMEGYRGWRELILYPDTFLVDREEIDEAGVVHASRQELAGESADRGAMVLSWGDITRDAASLGLDTALIIHECTHKLDALSGVTDGCPPLHREMSGARWRERFEAAYDRLCAALDAGEETALDPYAAHSPPEFLAVVSELFFVDPRYLRDAEPAIYEELRSFFRQDPAERMPPR